MARGDKHMSGLILKLRPHEELMVNGVVIQNGDRKTRLKVKTEGAAILRLRDAMRPEEATTSAKRAYYVAQLAVSGEISPEDAVPILNAAIARLREDYAGRPEIAVIAGAAEELASGRFYGVMRRLGELARPPRHDAGPLEERR
jgi:flagellar protein FlbT